MELQKSSEDVEFRPGKELLVICQQWDVVGAGKAGAQQGHGRCQHGQTSQLRRAWGMRSPGAASKSHPAGKGVPNRGGTTCCILLPGAVMVAQSCPVTFAMS